MFVRLFLIGITLFATCITVAVRNSYQSLHRTAKTSLIRQLDNTVNELTPVELRVQCDICQQWLKNQVSFRKHYNRHQHVSPNKAALNGYKRHRRREPKQHIYQECGKEFRKALTLREHMVSILYLIDRFTTYLITYVVLLQSFRGQF